MENNKVLIKLYVPMMDLEYEAWIPISKKLYRIVELLASAVKEFTDNQYKPQELPMIYNKETGQMYDLNLKIMETDIRNGSEIIMI